MQQPLLADRAPVVIRASNLTKSYTFHTQPEGLSGALKSLFHRETQTRLAVDAIDLEVRRGEIVGFLGPNGAGKTTTLKMLSGLLYPTAGNIEVLGFTPSRRQYDFLRRISLIMGQKTMLWWDVPAMDSFLLHKDMYDLPDDEFRLSVDALARMLDVTDLLHVQVRKLSLGERMKMELLLALLHQPDILFLDEPTIGLDVVAKARVREFLREVNRDRGTTIIITSHDMDDIEALCDRVVIINHGALEYDGSLSRLVHEVQPRKRIRAVYAEPIAPDEMGDIDADVVSVEGSALSLEVDRAELSRVMAQLPTLGDMTDMEVSDADIDEIIRTLFTEGRGQAS